jgi:Holliday junction DNA helicase RuvB
MLEVDSVGLEAQDRRYLQTLVTVFAGGPAGLSAIGHTMNVPPDTLEDEVEPFLLRVGFIQRNPEDTARTHDNFGGLEPPGTATGLGPPRRTETVVLTPTRDRVIE